LCSYAKCFNNALIKYSNSLKPIIQKYNLPLDYINSIVGPQMSEIGFSVEPDLIPADASKCTRFIKGRI